MSEFSSDLGNVMEDAIRQRIRHTLKIFPRLSHSMLQIGIGTGFPPRMWQPVLEQMVKEGEIKRSQTSATHPVSKRDQVYTTFEIAANANANAKTPAPVQAA